MRAQLILHFCDLCYNIVMCLLKNFSNNHSFIAVKPLNMDI